MTLHEAIRRGEDLLSDHGIEDPRWNAERMLLKALRFTRAQVYADLQRELSAGEVKAYSRLLDRRAQHEPLAYIEGTQEFYGREFSVDRSVLIPRPETEEIVRAALELKLPPEPQVLDLGAGSGAISLTLASEISGSQVIALEMSERAINLLRKNGRGKIHIVRGDLFAPPFRTQSFDLIVSNPPYVEEKEYALLPPETRHEPKEALVPASVEEVYRSLLKTATILLKRGGYLIFEIGAGQERLIERLILEQQGVSKIGSRSDFRKILRTFILQFA